VLHLVDGLAERRERELGALVEDDKLLDTVGLRCSEGVVDERPREVVAEVDLGVDVRVVQRRLQRVRLKLGVRAVVRGSNGVVLRLDELLREQIRRLGQRLADPLRRGTPTFFWKALLM